jgi:hypothetical protein
MKRQMHARLRIASGLIAVALRSSAGLAAPPVPIGPAAPPRLAEIRVHPGGDVQVPAALAGLRARSNDAGDDALVSLREGEWSVGQLVLGTAPEGPAGGLRPPSGRADPKGAPAPSSVPRARAPRRAVPVSGLAIRLRLAGAATRARFPALVRRGPVPLASGGVVVRESFVPGIRREGADLVAEVPLPPVEGMEDHYDLVDLAHSVEWTSKPELTADRADLAPLGDRTALVLVHGLLQDGTSPPGRRDPRADLWERLRASREIASLATDYKMFHFRYPTYRAARVNGESLARLVKRLVPAGLRRVVLLSHGFGAIVARHAAASPGMDGRIAANVSLAGAHHGSVLASLSFANDLLAERVGRIGWLLLKLGHMCEPDTPGLRSGCWDDHERSVRPADIVRYGLVLNPELAAFNGSGAGILRMALLAGDLGAGPGSPTSTSAEILGVPVQDIRAAIGAFDAAQASADPFVTLASALLDGPGARPSGAPAPPAPPGRDRPRQSIVTTMFPGLSHREMACHPEPLAEVAAILRGIGRTGRAGRTGTASTIGR